MIRSNAKSYTRTLAAAVLCAAVSVGLAPQALGAAAVELPKLAESGKFSQLLSRIQDQSDPQVLRLRADLEHYLKHQSQRESEQSKAYESAVKELDEHLAAQEVLEGLASALEAKELAPSPRDLLHEPAVAELTVLARANAAEAEEEHRWLDAMELYRALDLLYDDGWTYADDVERVERHVRLLQTYVPQRVHTLLVERAERLDKDAPEPLEDPDDWREALKNVEPKMLYESLSLASRWHVEGGGHVPLLRGAIDGLIALVNTPDLASEFESLNDAAKVKSFNNYLEEQRQQVDAQDELPTLSATRIVQDILRANARTLGLPQHVVVFEMANGAMSTLDEFTGVIWPRELEQFSRTTTGAFYGVGIQISRRNGRLVVVSPLSDTPAQRAGLKAGDIIASVDGRDTSAWSLDRAVREITGPEGTVVKIGIERPGNTEAIEFPLKRAKIEIESVRGWSLHPDGSWDYMIDPEQKIGYVRLSQFLPQTADELDAAINQMQEKGGPSALILDLRYNPGGLLTTAVEVADRFVKKGAIVSTVGSMGQRSEEVARPHKTYEPFPVVVLINEGSASASEIVAGALQDHGRAVIVGDRSFGKGSVQDLFPIDDRQAYLKLTTQYYKLPNGRIIHRKPAARSWGVEPDLHVAMTAQQMADAMEARRDLDVLREDAEKAAQNKAEPAQSDGDTPESPDTSDTPEAPAEDATEPAQPDSDEPEAAAADEDEAEDEPRIVVHSPQEMIDKSIDPQLEAALLVLKTRLVALRIEANLFEDAAAMNLKEVTPR